MLEGHCKGSYAISSVVVELGVVLASATGDAGQGGSGMPRNGLTPELSRPYKDAKNVRLCSVKRLVK